MKIAPTPNSEQARLATLKKYDILDTEPDAELIAMVELASYICQTPIAAISLIDENRQWFKVGIGLEAKETPRDVSFCTHTILQKGIMVVPDTLQDDRFIDNPLVTSNPDIRFYAGAPLEAANGEYLGALCVIDTVPRELNAKQPEAVRILAGNIMAHLELRLSHKNARLYIGDLQLTATIFDTASEAMLVTDANNLIIMINPAFTRITGYSLDEVVGQEPSILSSERQSTAFYQEIWQTLNETGHWDGELWSKCKNGEEFIQWLSMNVLFNEDKSKRLHMAVFSDITAKKQADALIWKQANYDHLTQLPNRKLFRDRLDQEIKIAQRSKQSIALLFIDLDYFKQVNDTLGHGAGDLLLIEAGNRIALCVRDADTVARIGGDEFTAILSHMSTPSGANKVAENIIQSLSRPYTVHGTQFNISASIGIAFYPNDGINVELLLKNTDNAMYAAKSSGRGCVKYATNCARN